ncbi:MAG: shikimate dehydrogenase [Lachnospiraceae bacterium]|nr:shikimate dehydrogenase [Lachnospiraceae bacterium]
MKRYGLIGEKLGHSYSKLIHEQLADYTYDLIPLSKEEFQPFMQAHDFAAINVTIPYKQDVIPYLDEISDSAKSIGAVNCIVNKEGRLCGYNTDYSGFLYSLRKNNIQVTGEKVLVLGNGGAAKAIMAALASLHPKELITVKYKEEPSVITYEQAAQLHSDASLIVNTSPVGMYPNVDASPVDLTPYQNLKAVVDIIYNPATTKLLAQAKERGITAVNGMEMLVAQAKYAVELFLDKELSDSRIEDVMNTLFPDN